MEKLMRRLTLWSGLGFLVTGACYGLYPQRFLLTIVITLLVIFYQLGMRLIVGNWLEPRLQLRPSAAWFKVGARERRLYRLLRVRRWKKWLPTQSPAKYDVRQHSLADIIKTMTYAEVDHELMLLLSYLPVLLVISFGNPAAFVISSVAASLVEVPFIVLQRYNRARLVNVLRRQAKSRPQNNPGNK